MEFKLTLPRISSPNPEQLQQLTAPRFPQINQESREPAEVFPLILPLKSIIKQRQFFLKQRKVSGFNFYYLSPRKMFSDILMRSGRRRDLPTGPIINPTISFSSVRLFIIQPSPPQPPPHALPRLPHRTSMPSLLLLREAPNFGIKLFIFFPFHLVVDSLVQSSRERLT